MRKSYIIILFLVALFFSNCNDEISDIDDVEEIPESTESKPIKDIVADVFPDGNVYIGMACHHSLFGTESVEILDREFDYVTPANDFKQSYIHPTPNKYQYEKSDDWVEHCQNNNQVLRLHAPISPQCSSWAREDDRTAEELDTMLVEYMEVLCKRYNGTSNILWLDVVNETIDTKDGDWFGPKEGTEKWENPWPKIGFDETHELRPPLYIKKAFVVANEYAPEIKQIINQHGALEQHSWDKMKALVAYLRENGLRVDGLGWQAHLELGWEKISGNIERLGEIVAWCHSNNLEFHITEFNVFLKNDNAGKYSEQANTFRAVTKAVLDHSDTGVVGINFWHVRGEDTNRKEWDGCLYDEKYKAKPAYYKIKELLESYK